MLDEPSLGIAPNLVDRIFEVITGINSVEKLTILLVEQNVVESLSLAHTGYVIQTGRTVLSGKAKDLLDSDMVRKATSGCKNGEADRPEWGLGGFDDEGLQETRAGGNPGCIRNGEWGGSYGGDWPWDMRKPISSFFHRNMPLISSCSVRETRSPAPSRGSRSRGIQDEISGG